VAAVEALLDALDHGSGDGTTELSEVVGVDLLGEAKSSVEDVSGGLLQEVLGDGRSTRVLGAQASNTNGRLAVEILLPVDGALREDGTLVLGDGGVELVVLVVLHHEASAHTELAGGGEGEELSGTRVDVRGVQATGLEEDGGSRDAETGEDGVVAALSEVNLATGAGGDRRVGGGVEVEVQADLPVIETLADGVEAGNGVGCGDERGNKLWRGTRVGQSAWDAESGGASTSPVGAGSSEVVGGSGDE